MILDIREIDGPVRADLCIVGGGAAGLCLAEAFRDSGLQVVVLEAGDRRESPQSQALFEGEVVGQAHPALQHYRVRALGGASRAWGGGCVPFDPVDFSNRPWLGAPGWPISYEELARFNAPALAAAEAGRYDMQPPTPLSPEIEGAGFITILERFSRPTNFAERWGQVLERAANVRVLLNACATEIQTAGANGPATAVIVTAPDGRKIGVQAKTFVLASGGIETTRLLLASTGSDPRGLGNQHGWLGRGYMCHVAGIVGHIEFNAPVDQVPFGFEQDADGVYFRRRLMLDPEIQRERQLLNIAFRLQRQDGGDPAHGDPLLSAIHLYKSLKEDEYTRQYRGTAATSGNVLGHLRNIARGPISLAGFAAATIKGRYLDARRYPGLPHRPKRSRFALEFHGEQAPVRDSRIELSDTLDALGSRRVKVAWRASPIDVETVKQTYRLLAQALAQSGAGRVDYSEEELVDRIQTSGAYGGHHIGATRMSARPEDGVVDANCRVHGVDNLYVASASAMPTSSQANPTLTILALTYRLADHLRGVLKSGSSVPAAAKAAPAGAES